MRKARRLLLAGTVVVALEVTTGAAGMLVLGPAEISLYLFVCAAATAAVTAIAVRVIASRPEGGEGDDGDGGGGGGGGGDDPPPWWPGFERDFWRHVQEREQTPV